jgi:hypothetical protein
MNEKNLHTLIHKLNNKACCVIGRIEIIEPLDLPDNLRTAIEIIKKSTNDMRSILLEINKEIYGPED